MTDGERKVLLDGLWKRYREESRTLFLLALRGGLADLSWHEYLAGDERLFTKFKAEEASILHQK